MNYILFGDQTRNHLLPFTFIRPLADVRIGILTMREKWEMILQAKTSSLTVDYLSQKYPLVKKEDNILVNSSVFPTPELVDELLQLAPNQTLVSGDLLIAHRLRDSDIDNLDAEVLDAVIPIETASEIRKLTYLWDFITMNGIAIVDDFALLTRGRKSQPLPSHVRVSAPENIFIEEGAILEHATINASQGPVYIGRDALIMDGAMIRGPVSVGQGSTVMMGARIYGNTTIGPVSKVGGEINNSIIFGYSNKSHDGFLGHSVVGEWCNIAADTNTSNLKIDYNDIRLWDYNEEAFVTTGLQNCGTFMGDHSKCGINTMFNTGTVIGVSAQVFGSGYMRNFIPSFTWGSVAGFSPVKIEKAIQTACLAYKRRNMELDKVDEDILRYVFEHTVSYRKV
jgi:UDP-N-acetylglucosamine diphosphorylase/glucosamine-1-phosphate N-acetyltransferase